jgi:hypothetical protein
MAVQQQKAKAKGKKVGRNKRKPAKQRYTNEERWIKNKARKIAKEKKRQARLSTKVA